MRGSVVAKCAKGDRRSEGRCSSRCVRWYFITEGPRTAEGKRRRLWSSGFPTCKAAEVALRAELHRRDQGIILEPERLTLSVYADRFLAHMATVRDPRTVERYGELLHLHVLPTLGNLQLKAITAAHLTDLYALLLHEGRRDGRSGGLSARTVGHVHRVVHGALRQAARWQLVARNVAADLELPRASDAPMMTLDHEQARRLLEAAEGTWLHVLVLLGATTGARRGELLALRWVDLDLEAGTARIRRSLQLVEGRLRVKETKTRAGDRTVGLGPSTVAALRRHRAEQAERRLAFGTAYDTAGDLVVCQVDGRPWRPDYCSAAFRALVRRACLPAAIHVHTLRHSAASFLAAEGLPASDIAAQLGHADGGALALRVYVHPLENEEWAREYERAGQAEARLSGQLEEAELRILELEDELQDMRRAYTQFTQYGQADEADAVEAPVHPPTTVLEAVQQAQAKCPHLVFLPQAFESAHASGFPRPSQVLGDLLAIEDVAARWQRGELTGDFRAAFDGQPVTFRAGISDTALRQYPGDYTRTYEGRQIVLGPHTRRGRGSPANILRIYWYPDPDNRVFVIGHVGRKLRDDSNP